MTPPPCPTTHTHHPPTPPPPPAANSIQIDRVWVQPIDLLQGTYPLVSNISPGCTGSVCHCIFYLTDKINTQHVINTLGVVLFIVQHTPSMKGLQIQWKAYFPSFSMIPLYIITMTVWQPGFPPCMVRPQHLS